jgi:hypothetical protein
MSEKYYSHQKKIKLYFIFLIFNVLIVALRLISALKFDVRDPFPAEADKIR